MKKKSLIEKINFIINAGKKEEYTKFFKNKLEEFNVKSPSELSEEEKKKFFTQIENEWKKD